MRQFWMQAAIFLWAIPVAAQPWIPIECANRPEQKWADYAREMRAAKPDSPIFAPKAYPRNSAEIIEDFRHGFLAQWRGKNLPEDQIPLYRGIESDSLSFKIVRVENWGPTRCLTEHQHDYYFLLFIADRVQGKELSRLALDQRGLLARWIMPPGDDEHWTDLWKENATPDLDEVLADVRTRYGIQGARPQYVASWGRPRCDVLAPCIAFMARGRFFLYRKGDLVEFTSASPGFSRKQMEATRQSRFEISDSIDTAKEWLVAVTDARWIRAKRVQPIQ